MTIRTFEEAHGVLWEAYHPFVPEKTYRGRPGYTCQVVQGSATFGLDMGEEPVVMLGSRWCRVHLRGSYRNYVTEMCERYIRRSRITCVDVDEWEKWLWKNLYPLLMKEKRAWCVSRQRASFDDIFRMVAMDRVVIEGKPTPWLDSLQASAIRRLYKTANRINGG